MEVRDMTELLSGLMIAGVGVSAIMAYVCQSKCAKVIFAIMFIACLGVLGFVQLPLDVFLYGIAGIISLAIIYAFCHWYQCCWRGWSHYRPHRTPTAKTH